MHAMQVMSALSQSTRLAVFKRLVGALPDGETSGDLASAVGAAANTMSAHLAILSQAGLVTSVKEGRTVTYRASIGPVEQLQAFLHATCRDQTRA